jgi:nucleoside-diphosphate-sugar epimerase
MRRPGIERHMKIAVTGASGFIGRYVIAELNSRNIDTVAIVRSDRTDFSHLGDVQVVRVDIAQPPSNVFDAIGKPDALIHLAWDGLPNYRSLHHFEVELPRQYTFLKQAVIQGLRSVTVSGTCLEYGMQSGPLSEECETRPANPYGFAKDALHKQLHYLQGTEPFGLTWARLFYVYGEGQSESSLLSQLKKAVGQGASSFNMSGGEQLRDFLSVAETARNLVDLTLKQRNVGPINICSGKPQSVRVLVEQWLRENNWSIRLNLGHFPYPEYEPMAFWGDRRKLEETLGLR